MLFYYNYNDRSIFQGEIISEIGQGHIYFHCEGSMVFEREGMVLQHAKITKENTKNNNEMIRIPCLTNKQKQ